jgi:hypothetical protein
MRDLRNDLSRLATGTAAVPKVEISTAEGSAWWSCRCARRSICERGDGGTGRDRFQAGARSGRPTNCASGSPPDGYSVKPARPSATQDHSMISLARNQQ